MIATMPRTADRRQLRTEWRPAVRQELRRFASLARGQRLRSRVEFAEQVIVIPEGPCAGERWRRDVQPWSYWVLHLMDTLGFRKFRGSGCVQSGKTFTFNVINCAYHLFERVESVGFMVPEMDMAETKWIEELHPVMESSPAIAPLLPRSGAGSRGGFGTLIKFQNGASLKFLGGSGKDSRRSGATLPVILKTEVDRYDTATASSRETPPTEQGEARTAAFDELAYSYEECTVTTEDGRIWTEINEGTGTQLYVRCPECGEHVLPHREDLVGIDECADVIEAGERGAFACPACKSLWTEQQRDEEILRVDRIVPVHRGQTIHTSTDGLPIIEGEMPRTDRLSISANAFHNKFWRVKSIAKEEWRALYTKHPDEQDLKRRQFAWVLPAESKDIDLVNLTLGDTYKRYQDTGLRVVPPNTRWLSRGVDPSKRRLHYVVRAWSTEDGDTWFGRAIDIGEIPVEWESLGVREGLIDALTTLRTKREVYHDSRGEAYPVHMSLVDLGWMEEVIWAWLLDLHERDIKGWMGVLGRGQSEPPGSGSYVHPRKIDPVKGPVLWRGENCHIRLSDTYNLPFVMENSDEWKTFIHQGLGTPLDKNGALSHFEPVDNDERRMIRQYLKEVLSETPHLRKVPRRGPVIIWEHDNAVPNHRLDSDCYSCVGGNCLGVRIVTREPTSITDQSGNAGVGEVLTMPDGRPYMQV